MPTPVGPAPRDPNDPDFWDFSDEVYGSGGHDDPRGDADLARQRARRRLMAIVIVALVLTLLIVASL